MGLIAIIGGTGVCDPKILSNVREGYLDTYYGSIRYWKGTYNDRDLIFLARQGQHPGTETPGRHGHLGDDGGRIHESGIQTR